MKRLRATLGEEEIEVLLAESGKERRAGMRALPCPAPLLLRAAPLIHTWGCPPLDLLWIRQGVVVRALGAQPQRLYFAPAWLCLELPSGSLDKWQVEKGSPFAVLGEI